MLSQTQHLSSKSFGPRSSRWNDKLDPYGADN